MQDIDLRLGNCYEIIKTLDTNSIDSVVTDPPYGFKFMGNNWDQPDNIVFSMEYWKEILRILKPGAHILVFSGSRTYHWLATAIEKAGFEIRDQIMWLYGSGFPKSHNISKAIDKQKGLKPIKTNKVNPNWLNKDGSITNRNIEGAGKVIDHNYGFKNVPMIEKPNSKEAKIWQGWGTCLKPAHEPVVLARKPLEKKLTIAKNVLKYGTGAINIDECRIPFENGDKTSIAGKEHKRGKNINTNLGANQSISIQNDKDRFPANIIHDGSDEVVSHFPDSKGSGGSIPKTKVSGYGSKIEYTPNSRTKHNSGKGSAARFFYCAKANKKDRDEGLDQLPEQNIYQDGNQNYGFKNTENDNLGDRFANVKRKNNHPTVKPTKLMKYLIKLISPPNTLVLDPFMGSGSTGKALLQLNKELNKNYSFIGIELNEEYFKIAAARVAAERKGK